MISTMVANLPVFLFRTTRPTSTNLQLEALTIESVDIFGLLYYVRLFRFIKINANKLNIDQYVNIIIYIKWKFVNNNGKVHSSEWC